MTFHDILAALPNNALLPVSWVRTQVSIQAARDDQGYERDLSVRQFAALVDRSAGQVRVWCAAGSLPGAYRLPGAKRNGAWRIPRTSVDAFRQHGTTPVVSERPEREAKAADLGAWRRGPRRPGGHELRFASRAPRSSLA